MKLISLPQELLKQGNESNSKSQRNSSHVYMNRFYYFCISILFLYRHPTYKDTLLHVLSPLAIWNDPSYTTLHSNHLFDIQDPLVMNYN